MKKTIILLCLLLTLCACGEKGDESSSNNSTPNMELNFNKETLLMGEKKKIGMIRRFSGDCFDVYLESIRLLNQGLSFDMDFGESEYLCINYIVINGYETRDISWTSFGGESSNKHIVVNKSFFENNNIKEINYILMVLSGEWGGDKIYYEYLDGSQASLDIQKSLLKSEAMLYAHNYQIENWKFTTDLNFDDIVYAGELGDPDFIDYDETMYDYMIMTKNGDTYYASNGLRKATNLSTEYRNTATENMVLGREYEQFVIRNNSLVEDPNTYAERVFRFDDFSHIGNILMRAGYSNIGTTYDKGYVVLVFLSEGKLHLYQYKFDDSYMAAECNYIGSIDNVKNIKKVTQFNNFFTNTIDVLCDDGLYHMIISLTHTQSQYADEPEKIDVELKMVRDDYISDNYLDDIAFISGEYIILKDGSVLRYNGPHGEDIYK